MKSWARTFVILTLVIAGFASPVLAAAPADAPPSWADAFAQRLTDWVQVILGADTTPPPPPVALPEDPVTTGCTTCSGDGGEGDNHAGIDPNG